MNILQEKALETTKEKGKRRNTSSHRPKPEEQEGMPQQQHCPPAKCEQLQRSRS
jgi:hypothetical protein